MEKTSAKIKLMKWSNNFIQEKLEENKLKLLVDAEIENLSLFDDLVLKDIYLDTITSNDYSDNYKKFSAIVHVFEFNGKTVEIDVPHPESGIDKCYPNGEYTFTHGEFNGTEVHPNDSLEENVLYQLLNHEDLEYSYKFKYHNEIPNLVFDFEKEETHRELNKLLAEIKELGILPGIKEVEPYDLEYVYLNFETGASIISKTSSVKYSIDRAKREKGNE